jgi:hypothetical protein
MATRLFYVLDSDEANEEIFETLEDAEGAYAHENSISKTARLYIAQVRNAYRISELSEWNYEDHADTFTIIKILK